MHSCVQNTSYVLGTIALQLPTTIASAPSAMGSVSAGTLGSKSSTQAFPTKEVRGENILNITKLIAKTQNSLRIRTPV